MHLGELIFNSLIKLNERFEAVSDLAESWQVSAGGLVWDFKIKRGVLFHDGKELTAEDVAFTYNAIINPRVKSPHASLYDMVKSFKAAGRYMFRVELNEPYSPLLFIMDQHILPAHLLEQSETAMYDFGRNPVGSGPFKFSEWRNGEIILLANDRYFEGRPNLDRVILKSFASRLSAWSALMQGKTDVVSDLNFEDFRIIRDDPRFKTYDYLSFFYYTILFNLEDPLFSDRTLRRALDLAIDRGDIVEKALKGWGIATTGPFRPGAWTYNNDVTSQRYNPKEAAQLLKELGWQDSDRDRILDKEGKKLSFTLLVDKGDSLKELAAKRIRWQLFQQGIEVKVEFQENELNLDNIPFFKRIGTRIIIFSTLVLVMAVLSTGLLIVRISTRVLRSNISQRNMEIARRTASEISLYIKDSLDQLYATSEIMATLVHDPLLRNIILENLSMNLDKYRCIYLLDGQGNIITTSNLVMIDSHQFDPIAAKEAVEQDLYISAVKLSADNLPYITIALPVKTMGEKISILAAELNLRDIWDIIDDISVGESGAAFLISGQGLLIAHPDKTKVLQLFDGGQIPSDISERGTVILQEQRFEPGLLIVYQPVESVDWIVGIQQPIKEAYLPGTGMRPILK